MSTTTQTIVQIRDERAKREAEEARWTRYRTDANPPVWFTALALFAAFYGILAFAEYLLGHPDALRSPFGLLIFPGAAILTFGMRLLQRREKAILRAITDEAPELFEKLKEERLIR
jgi:antibiotic biosynthesis monooxygenase (ABM) superfamily enzyme